MKLVVNALIASLPSMTNVLIVCLLFTTIFAITGINFFKGQFWKCQPHDAPIPMDLVMNKWDCHNLGGDWDKIPSNFDNTITAVLTLFEMMTTEGWMNVLYDGIDATGID